MSFLYDGYGNKYFEDGTWIPNIGDIAVPRRGPATEDLEFEDDAELYEDYAVHKKVYRVSEESRAYTGRSVFSWTVVEREGWDARAVWLGNLAPATSHRRPLRDMFGEMKEYE